MIIKLLQVLGILFIVAVAAVLMFPPVTRGREAARRTQCKNNLKQILLALSNYESTYHTYPPAFTVDANGNRLHSWRTLLLPFLDHQQLYEKIDLSKPWNAPINAEAHHATLNVFCCPATKLPQGMTTYVAVVGTESFFSPIEPRRLAEVSDNRFETLAVIEVVPEHAVHWMEPVDTSEKIMRNFGTNPKRPHVGGTHAAMVDGSVRFLSAGLPESQIRALISIAGDDAAGDF